MNRTLQAALGPSFKRPVALFPGDEVRILAPSSPFDEQRFQRGLQVIKDMGLRPALAKNLRARSDYLAGDDAARLADLQEALADPSLKCIWAARGGYGSTRLLPHLGRLRPVTPKLLVGFSDISALHSLWFTHYAMCSLHGPVVTSLADEPANSVGHLKKILFGQAMGTRLKLDAQANQGLRDDVKGSLFATNLSLLAALAGTVFAPDLERCVLVVEEVGERPYRLDRLWTQIRQSGVLAGLEAIVLGYFSDCAEADGVLQAEDGLRRALDGLSVPIYRGVQVGHRAPNFALPLGCDVRVGPGFLRLEQELVLAS